MVPRIESPLETAVRALRRRDHTAASLGAYLDLRGVGREERDAAVTRVRELGYLDDERFAARRAERLVARGCGDAFIAFELERGGVSPVLAEEVIAMLEPEAERAARIVACRGTGARTLRYLAAKGYSAEVLDAYVADAAEGAVG